MCPTAPAAASTPNAEEIYVSNNDSITSYPVSPVGLRNEAPIASIVGSAKINGATALSGLKGIALDVDGNIYVSSLTASAIAVYSPNPIGTLNEAPIAAIAGPSTGLGNNWGVALDANNEVNVVNRPFGGNGPNVELFDSGSSGNTGPLAGIAGNMTGLSNPDGLAIDAIGLYYVSNDSGLATASITVYPGGLQDNQLTNELPLATIAGSLTNLQVPTGIAVDATGKVYVADANGFVDVYAAVPLSTTNQMLDEKPLAIITGSKTGLSDPVGIALDSSGDIYVANNTGCSGSSITVYAANPSGTLNEAPLGTIAGGNTGLSGAEGIAIFTPPSLDPRRGFARRP
jgi:hypothetical protein